MRQIIVLTILMLSTTNMMPFALQLYSVDTTLVRGKYVYDYANVISAQYEQVIHDYCQFIDQNTTCEIVVYTETKENVKEFDLAGYAVEVFNEHELPGPDGTYKGIGKKDANNGVLLIYVENKTEKKGQVRIATGYGVEYVLPDHICGDIVDEKFVPTWDQNSWEQGKLYDKAFNDTVSAIGQRILEKYEGPPEPGQGIHPIWYMIIAGLVAYGIFAIIVVVVIVPKIENRWQNYYRTRILKKKLKNMITDYKDDDEEMLKEIDRIEDIAKNYPQWAKEEAKTLLNECRKKAGSTDTIVLAAEVASRKNPESALETLKEVNTIKDEVAQMLFVVGSEIPRRIKMYKESAPTKVNQLNEIIQGTEKLLKSKKEAGLNVDTQTKLLEKVGAKSTELEQKLKGHDVNYKEVYEEANAFINELNSANDSISRMVRLMNNNALALGTLSESLTRVEKGITPARNTIEQLKDNHPKSVWGELEENLNTVPALIGSAKADIEVATRMNSIGTQNFTGAEQKIDNAEMKINEARNKVDAAFRRSEELHNAKNRAPSLLREAESMVSEAKDLVRNSNVSYSTRDEATDAERELSNAKSMLARKDRGEMIDWLALIVLLTSAIALAGSAMQKVRRDMDDAEEKRRRERRRREEDEWHDHWSSSSWSSGGSHSGGFGGGGGTTGGGGAGRGLG